MHIPSQFSAITQPATVKRAVLFDGIREKNRATLGAEVDESIMAKVQESVKMLARVEDRLRSPITSTGVTGEEVLKSVLETLAYDERRGGVLVASLLKKFSKEDQGLVENFLIDAKLVRRFIPSFFIPTRKAELISYFPFSNLPRQHTSIFEAKIAATQAGESDDYLKYYKPAANAGDFAEDLSATEKLDVGQAMLESVRDKLSTPLTSNGITGREVLEFIAHQPSMLTTVKYPGFLRSTLDNSGLSKTDIEIVEAFLRSIEGLQFDNRFSIQDDLNLKSLECLRVALAYEINKE